jgi:hypothetical protein
LNVLIQQFNDGQAVTESQIDDARARAIAAQASADVAQTTADTSQASADSAKAAADAAQAVADQAVADAQAAQTTADEAKAAALSAATDAATAQSTADSAQDAAADAQTAADAAQATADNALAVAQQALANAATAQASADAALAVANQALANAPHTVIYPNQAIPDNVGTYDDAPTGSLTLEPGTYLFTFGGTFNQSFGVRIRIQGGAVISATACQAAGTRFGTGIATFTATTTILLEHDSCGANIPQSFTGPFIQYIKVA